MAEAIKWLKWRWTPFFALLTGALVAVLLTRLLIPSEPAKLFGENTQKLAAANKSDYLANSLRKRNSTTKSAWGSKPSPKPSSRKPKVRTNPVPKSAARAVKKEVSRRPAPRPRTTPSRSRLVDRPRTAIEATPPPAAPAEEEEEEAVEEEQVEDEDIDTEDEVDDPEEAAEEEGAAGAAEEEAEEEGPPPADQKIRPNLIRQLPFVKRR